MNKTKIICSIGPASTSVKVLEKMIDAGMNVARFNMSHGTHESQLKMINAVKKTRQNKKVPLAIMIDTKGPEIRIKQFENGSIILKNKAKFILTPQDIIGTQKRVGVTYQNLAKILKIGDKILANDGMIEFKVIAIDGNDVICTVVHGGVLSNNKSLNLPGIKTDMPYLSEQDKKDIKFAKEVNADYLAISFVNSANDVKDIKKYLNEIDFQPKIISKIESEEGVINFDQILDTSDGIMVARGDLGVEIDFVKIPILQKQFIKKCNTEGKIVITATQMLESMITNVMPTRAEISDVANAILDGTTATMLSGETASGKHPIESVKTMKLISEEIEKHAETKPVNITTNDNAKSIAYATYALSQTKNIKGIVAVTNSGETAKNISCFRPSMPIIACTPNEEVYHKMSMLYGVCPVLDQKYDDINELNKNALQKSLETGLLNKNDKVVLVSSIVTDKSGTNLMAVKKL